jgi:hypothetical protein
MKKLLTFLLLLPSFSFAQDNIPEIVNVELKCYNTAELFKYLMANFKEQPIILGQTQDEGNSIMTFWVNDKTRSWTITATIKDTSCIVGYGKNINLVNL